MSRNTQSVRVTDLAGLQYVGIPGVSRSCYRALERFVQCGEKIEEARLISSEQRHAFLLKIAVEEYVIVQSGFATGYTGEGPHALSEALQLLRTLDIPIEEVDVPCDLFRRLQVAALTKRDFTHLREAAPVTPWRWPDYIFEWRHTVPNDVRELQKMPLTMPWPLIDLRLSDLAFEFLDRPEDSLMKGFRRLEEVLRKRTALDDHGTKLLAKAFSGDSSRLTWPNIDTAEHTGRAQLFTGSFMAFRNPLAHREQRKDERALLHQFLQLNQLFLLEGQSCRREEEHMEKIDSVK